MRANNNLTPRCLVGVTMGGSCATPSAIAVLAAATLSALLCVHLLHSSLGLSHGGLQSGEHSDDDDSRIVPAAARMDADGSSWLHNRVKNPAVKNVVPGRRRTLAVVKPTQVNKLPPLSTLLPKAPAPAHAQERTRLGHGCMCWLLPVSLSVLLPYHAAFCVVY